MYLVLRFVLIIIFTLDQKNTVDVFSIPTTTDLVNFSSSYLRLHSAVICYLHAALVSNFEIDSQ